MNGSDGPAGPEIPGTGAQEPPPRRDFGWGDPAVFEDMRARRRRRWAFAGAFLAVLLGGAGAFALFGALGGDGPEAASTTVTTGGGNGGTGTPASTVPVLAPELEWYAVDGTLGYLDRIFADSDGTLYALSTVPGRNFDWPPPKALYVSEDGESWEAVRLDDTIYANDMAVRNGVVYLIGTAPEFNAFDAPARAVLSRSDDGGVTWTSEELPSEATPPTNVQVGWHQVFTKVAAGAKGVVAAVQTSYNVDYWQLVPQQLLEGNRGVNVLADGVDVVDYSVYDTLYAECDAAMSAAGVSWEDPPDDWPEPCLRVNSGDVPEAIVAHLTWGELGLDETGLPSFSELFVSSDGVTFEAVPSPFFPGRALGGLWAHDDGFLAMEWLDRGVAVWTSEDGRTWEEMPNAPIIDFIAAAGSYAGEPVLVGNVGGVPTVAWRGPAGWQLETVDPTGDGASGEGTWMSTAAVGPLGVVVVFQTFEDPVGEKSVILHGREFGSWTQIPIDTVTPRGIGFSDWVVVGADRVVLRFLDWGGQLPVNLQIVGSPSA